MQTLAEKAAWDLSKKHGFELVTVNPTFVFGPVLSNRADATSVLMMKVCDHSDAITSFMHALSACMLHDCLFAACYCCSCLLFNALVVAVTATWQT